MKKIIIDFFPVVGAADLWFEEDSGKSKVGNAQRNSLANRLKTTGIDEWLYPYRKGYQVWRGLLMELMDEVDDDDLRITIKSPRVIYDKISQALNAQKDETDDMGFRHDAFRLTFEQSREMEDCKKSITGIYEQCSTFMRRSNQETQANTRAYMDKLESAETFDDLYEASKLLVKLMDQEIELYNDNENVANEIAKRKNDVKEQIWGECDD